MPRSKALAVLLCAAAGVAVASLLQRFAPEPVASVGEGTEDAFAHSGLEDREIPPGSGPIRWTRGVAQLAFEDLPAGSVLVEVRLRSNAAPVRVAVNGRLVGVIEPGGPRALFEAPEGPRDGRVLVELRTETMQRGERRLGALLAHVRIARHERSLRAGALGVRLGLCAGLAAAAALAVGLAAWPAAVFGSLSALLGAVALWGHGLVWSAYAARLPWLLAIAAAAAALLARLGLRRAPPGSGGPGGVLAALAVAFVVQGIAATSPVMVASDVVFHAHVLRDVAAGDWFPTSVSQHAQPFRIPYGSAFYALLVPWARAGADLVPLVRAGAALGGCAASIGFLWLLLPLGAGRAALAVLLLQTLPGSFDVFSAGNLSNAFGQSLSVLLLAWWSGGTPLGFPLGAALLASAAVSHLSSAIVLVFVIAALAVARRGRLGRPRLLAVGFGLAVAGWYYAHYAGLVAEQIPRLLEGGGQGRGGVVGFGGALAHQLMTIVREWGIPAIALACFARFSGGGGLERDLRAYVCGAALLLMPALVSPLEVRYVLALGPGVAWFAADGTSRLWTRGLQRRVFATALLAIQAGLAVANVLDAVYFRYR